MNKKTKVGFGLVVILLFGLVLFVVVFPMRRLGYVDSAIGQLRVLSNGLHEYATAHPQQGFPNSVREMYTSGLINETMAREVRNHYQFIYLPGIPSVRGIVERYQIHANPTDGSKGLHFFIDETGVIREAEDRPANGSSSPL
jgi:hypothetical protein